MEKIRTTIYLSRSARLAAGDLIESHKFSSFIEQCIFDHYSGKVSRSGIEKEISSLQKKLLTYQNNLGDHDTSLSDLEALKERVLELCDVQAEDFKTEDIHKANHIFRNLKYTCKGYKTMKKQHSKQMLDSYTKDIIWNYFEV